MKVHRNYKFKYWFGIMLINGFVQRTFGNKQIYKSNNLSFNDRCIKAKPRCWLEKKRDGDL